MLNAERKCVCEMNVLFLIYHGLEATSGISKKIIAQMEGLRQNGHTVHFCSYSMRDDGHRCRFVDNLIISDFGTGHLASLRKRCSYQDVFRYCVGNAIEAVYVRSFHNANPWTIRLFKKLRKAGIAAVQEIPTYPYDSEYDNFPLKDRVELCIDKIFRHALAAQMERMVTFTNEPYIFGCRTICISNGIDFNAIPLRQPVGKRPGEFHLLGVAEVHPWHAYDRMIKGIADYYSANDNPATKVYFHIVGGVCMADKVSWSSFIREHNIESYVLFHSPQSGDALTESFNQADFAIGSLGRHRSHIDKIKTLKNREYAARGIPFIYSETDDDFEDMPYVLKAPADESNISVDAILDFYSKCSCSPSEIRESIRFCSWKEQMRIVMDNLHK